MPKLVPPCVRALLLACSLPLAFAGQASAIEIAEFDAQVVKKEPVDGVLVFDQAGGHPYEGYTRFRFATDANGRPTGVAEDLRVDIPPGLIPNPHAIPMCEDHQLDTGTCPSESQVGVEELTAYIDPLGLGVPGAVDMELPLYNMELKPGQVARIAFNPADATAVPGLAGPVLSLLMGLGPVEIVGGVRDTGDFGMFFTISDLPESAPTIESNLRFWGVPSADDHDPERGRACFAGVCTAPRPGVAPGEPFLTNPTKCGGVKLRTDFRVTSRTGATDSAFAVTPTGPDGEEGPQHCEDVPFDSTVSVTPDTAQPDAPTGPLVELVIPQTGLEDPDVLATSHVKDVAITLPPGMTLNPSAANGLQACTDAQLGAKTKQPVTCPEASRLGSVTIDTPLLEDPLTGSAYLGKPLPGDRYRLFLAAAGQGVDVRLKGSVRPNPATGQLTTVFANNPEVPFSRLAIDFRGGALAPLATPLECGPRSATGRLVPYSGNAPDTPTSAPFTIGPAGCGAAFAPSFLARSDGGQAGGSSPFRVSFARQDRQPYLSRVAVETPPGLLGRLSSVPQCPEPQAAAGTCAAASRIGTVSVRSGAGDKPYALSGPVYLTGPYGGGQFGMSIVVRALAGPFDLGTVVVRQAIHVDRDDARLRVVSDPLPRILEGIPLRIRSVAVALDRPGFMVHPTSCGSKPVRSLLAPASGAGVARAAALAFSGCDRLGLRPKLSLALTGKRQLAEGRHPGVRAVLTQKAGESNLKGVKVALPLSLALEPENAEQLCEYEAGLRADCPRASIIGRARARSPILNRPLSGPIYFVKGVRFQDGRPIRTMPTMLITLRGEVAIDLRATTAVGGGGKLVTTFPAIPDTPVSRFEMSIDGGEHGILAVVRRQGLCGARHVATTRMEGHNGKALGGRVRMTTPCKRNRRVSLGKVRWGASTLAVAGRASARGPVRVSVRCGATRLAKRARVKGGRWKAALPLRGRCASARKATLTVRLGGAKASRTIRR